MELQSCRVIRDDDMRCNECILYELYIWISRHNIKKGFKKK